MNQDKNLSLSLEELGQFIAGYHCARHPIPASQLPDSHQPDSQTKPVDQAAEDFARYLRAERNKARLTQQELAHKADLSETTIFALEKGLILSTMIRTQMLQKLADALALDVAHLALMLDRPIPARGVMKVFSEVQLTWAAVVAYFGSPIKAMIVLALMICTLLSTLFYLDGSSQSILHIIPSHVGGNDNNSGLSPALNIGFSEVMIVILFLLGLWFAIWRGDVPFRFVPGAFVGARRIIYATLTALMMFASHSLPLQDNTSGFLFPPREVFGDGRDGVMPTSGNLDNDNGFSIGSVIGTAGSTTISVTDGHSVSRINPGDIVLLHQTQGSNMGCWELNKAVSYMGSRATIYELVNPLQCTYSTDDINHAQILRVPQYSTCNMTGVATPFLSWDGTRDGFFAVMCSEKMQITDTIHNYGHGFRGVSHNPIYRRHTGYQSERYSEDRNKSYTINSNGGGGGAGGGGGHATRGGFCSASNLPSGEGGFIVENSQLTVMYFGGGGGAGGSIFVKFNTENTDSNRTTAINGQRDTHVGNGGSDDIRIAYGMMISDELSYIHDCPQIRCNISSHPAGTNTRGWDNDSSYGDWYGGREITRDSSWIGRHVYQDYVFPKLAAIISPTLPDKNSWYKNKREYLTGNQEINTEYRNQTAHTFSHYIQILNEMGITSGYNEICSEPLVDFMSCHMPTSYTPNKIVTRGSASKFIARVLVYKQNNIQDIKKIGQQLANSIPLNFNSSTGGKIGSVRFADEDILVFDPDIGRWAMYFDRSNTGIKVQDADAFYILDDSSIFLSLHKPIKFAEIKIDDSDIVKFTATLLDEPKQGSFSRYFNSSLSKLTKASEDIDAISFHPNGNLVISTLGNFNVNYRAKFIDISNSTSPSIGTNQLWTAYSDKIEIGIDLAGANGLSIFYPIASWPIHDIRKIGWQPFFQFIALIVSIFFIVIIISLIITRDGKMIRALSGG